VHLVDVDHLLPTAHLIRVANAWHVTLSTTALVGIVEEWCAVAFITALEAKELDAADVVAKFPAYLWSHGHAVLLLHVVVVPTLLLGLRIDNAPNAPVAGDATLGVNRIWFWEGHGGGIDVIRSHRSDEKALAFMSQIIIIWSTYVVVHSRLVSV
jgi:hypothetical protein